jgi:hypothetical protein
MQKYKVKITGQRALLMHNSQLADPLHPTVRRIKQLTAKGQSRLSDEEHHELAELEFFGGLYLCSTGPCLLEEQILAGMRDSATAVKRGLKSAIIGGVTIEDDEIPVIYKGPRVADELWVATDKQGKKKFVDRRIVNLNPNSAKISRGPRTRPRFDPPWSAEFTVLVADDLGIGLNEMKKLFAVFGAMHGIGDGRKVGFGRFTSTVKKVTARKAA